MSKKLLSALMALTLTTSTANTQAVSTSVSPSAFIAGLTTLIVGLTMVAPEWMIQKINNLTRGQLKQLHLVVKNNPRLKMAIGVILIAAGAYSLKSAFEVDSKK